MIIEFGYFNLRTSFTKKKGKNRETKSIIATADCGVSCVLELQRIEGLLIFTESSSSSWLFSCSDGSRDSFCLLEILISLLDCSFNPQKEE